MGSRLVIVAVAALLGALVFGGADQFLGSFSAHPWAADVSLLSAPWLVLPFAAGATQRDPRKGAWLGLGCTLAALVGYGLMTLSPLENAHLTTATAAAFVRSQRLILGGIITGPLFGWWGSRWRTDRAFAGALLTALAVTLEPAAHRLAPARIGGVFLGQAIRYRPVSMTEMTAGVAMAIYFVGATLRQRRAR